MEQTRETNSTGPSTFTADEVGMTFFSFVFFFAWLKFSMYHENNDNCGFTCRNQSSKNLPKGLMHMLSYAR